VKNYISILFFILFANISLAQIQGNIKDEEGNLLSEVNIYFPDQKLLLISDKNGNFSLESNLPDKSLINFYKLGYASKIYTYRIGDKLNISLKKLHVELDEIGISDTYNELGSNKFTNIEKKKIDKDYHSTFSVLEKVSELNGVDLISSGKGIQKLVVRGLSGMRVVTFLNGAKINNQQWADDHGIGFSDLGIYEVELIKGASALKFGGESIGGIVFFKDDPFFKSEVPKTFVSTKFDNSNFLSSNKLGFSWSKDNYYLTFNAQTNFASDYRLPNGSYLFNSRYLNNALKTSISTKFSKSQHIFRFQYNNNTNGIPGHIHGNPEDVTIDELSSSSVQLPDDYKETRPTQFINDYLYIYESNYFIGSNTLSLTINHFKNNLVEMDKWTRPAFDLTSRDSELRANLKSSFKDYNFNFGFSYLINSNTNGENDNYLPATDRLIPDAVSNNLGTYLISEYQKDNLGFNVGLRFDNKNLTVDEKSYDKVFNAFNYSVGSYYELNDQILRLSFTTSFRAPHISEIFSDGVHHGTNRYEIGGPSIGIEKAKQIDLKYRWNSEHFAVVLNPYYQFIEDFISITPTDSFYSNTYRIYNFVQYDDVKMSGIELNLHYHPHILHNLHIEQSYNFISTNAKTLVGDYGIAMTPSDKIKTKFILSSVENDLLSKLKIEDIMLKHTFSFKQDNISFIERPTNSYSVIDFEIRLKSLLNGLNSAIAVNNVLNEEYTPHTSRMRGLGPTGVPNPGRSFAISMKYNF